MVETFGSTKPNVTSYQPGVPAAAVQVKFPYRSGGDVHIAPPEHPSVEDPMAV
jgi:hypothetical protein